MDEQYNKTQLMLTASLWLAHHSRPWFEGRFLNAGRRKDMYPRLLIGLRLSEIDKFPVTIAEAARIMGCGNPNTTTKAIARLVALKLVRVRGSAGDRRSKELALTRVGRTLVRNEIDKLLRERAAYMRDMIAAGPLPKRAGVPDIL